MTRDEIFSSQTAKCPEASLCDFCHLKPISRSSIYPGHLIFVSYVREYEYVWIRIYILKMRSDLGQYHLAKGVNSFGLKSGLVFLCDRWRITFIRGIHSCWFHYSIRAS